MEKRIDNLGRIVIPREMRKSIGVEDGDNVTIELIDNKIVISNPSENDEFLNFLNEFKINHDSELCVQIENEYKRIKGIK